MSKPNNLESLWMPFTPNKTFKKDPRIIVKAKDMHLPVMIIVKFLMAQQVYGV